MPEIDTWLEFVIYPTEDGLSVYFKNINDRKESEKKMYDLNHSLKAQTKELETRNGTIEFENLPTIKAVPVTMKLLLQNLISNGLKYQKPDSNPKIKLVSYESENYFHFSVIDNGIGIEEEYFDKIFLLFNRLHGNEVYQGSGLGLALCKKIIEQHGGTIGVKSTPDNGSEFFFTIKKE